MLCPIHLALKNQPHGCLMQTAQLNLAGSDIHTTKRQAFFFKLIVALVVSPLKVLICGLISSNYFEVKSEKEGSKYESLIDVRQHGSTYNCNIDHQNYCYDPHIPKSIEGRCFS